MSRITDRDQLVSRVERVAMGGTLLNSSNRKHVDEEERELAAAAIKALEAWSRKIHGAL